MAEGPVLVAPEIGAAILTTRGSPDAEEWFGRSINLRHRTASNNEYAFHIMRDHHMKAAQWRPATAEELVLVEEILSLPEHRYLKRWRPR